MHCCHLCNFIATARFNTVRCPTSHDGSSNAMNWKPPQSAVCSWWSPVRPQCSTSPAHLQQSSICRQQQLKQRAHSQPGDALHSTPITIADAISTSASLDVRFRATVSPWLKCLLPFHVSEVSANQEGYQATRSYVLDLFVAQLPA